MEIYVEKQVVPDAIKKLLVVAGGLPGFHHIQNVDIAMTFGSAAVALHQPLSVKDILGHENLAPAIAFLSKEKLPSVFKSCGVSVSSSHNWQQTSWVLSLERHPFYDKIKLNIQEPNSIVRSVPAVEHVLQQYEAVREEAKLLKDSAFKESAQGHLVAELTRRITDSAVDLRTAAKEGLERFLEAVTTVDKEMLEKFHAEHAKLRGEADQERTQLRTAIDEERTQLRTAIDEERAQLRAETDAERKKLQQEYETQQQALQQERVVFEEEKRKLDDRRNTHVRREVFGKLQELLTKSKQVELSTSTNAKTKNIWFLSLLLASFGAVLMGLGFYLTVYKTEIGWFRLLPLSSGVIIVVSSVLYLIRFANAWLARHADLETRNQLLQVDMARASWFAEMLFEYKDEKQGAVPDAVIQVMTKNLFDVRPDSGAVSHPVDEVAAFVGRINRIRLANGEVEMDANKNKG